MRLALLTLVIVLVLVVGGAVTFLLINRERLLQSAVAKVKSRLERRYPVRFELADARFTNLTTVAVRGVRLTPRAGEDPTILPDTLLRVGRVTATISLKSIFRLRPVFANLTLEDVRFTALKRDSLANNFAFLLRSRKAGESVVDSVATAARKGRQWGRLLNSVLDAAFENIPEEATFERVAASYHSPHHTAALRMPRLRVNAGRIRASFVLQFDSVRNAVRFNGTLDPDDYQISLIAYSAAAHQPLVMPYITAKYHARATVDTLRLILEGKDYDVGAAMCTVRGFTRLNGLRVYHHRIADHPIGFPNTAGRFVATFGPDYLSLDQPTALQVGKIVVSPQATYRGQPSRQVELHIRTNELPANDVFASLPTGMFDELEGMRAQGTMRYSLDFAVDTAQLDSLRFDSNLEGRNFRVTRFGRADLSKLSREFPYTAYDDEGDSVKTFLVGPSNPKFVPYDDVSPYLRFAILTAEDPRFFTHRGFMESAFRKSLIQNIRERRFARGGSTLSMQLVKNVFLTRKKTIARKIEETLIVWIIEHNEPRFVSKERMFEVYLNLIEWGPRKYGVYEAAQFFFAKHPRDLNLNEGLFLASIIPSPRRYKRSFDEYGNLRGKPRYFFKIISQLMLQRGLITQADYERLWPGVTLNGPARDLIITARDTTADTLDLAPIMPPDFIGPTMPQQLPKQLPMGAKKEDASDVLE